jgi:electron transfer flavoprotein beta subunit
MNIVVCVKRVPKTQDADVEIEKGGGGIDTSGMAFDLNEWDSYAIEEAIRLKEALSGSVTVLSMGGDEANEALRKCLAMGADEAVRLTDAAFDGSDGYATATALAEAIRKTPYDLILTGTQAEDDGYGQVGVAVAKLLGLPHATVVNKLATDCPPGTVRVHRELEGGLEEVLELKLPAVVTIQTGINEPRYVSIMGIRKVAKKEIPVWGASDLNLSADKVGLSGSCLKVEELFLPPAGEGAQILDGSPEEVSLKVVDILKNKGGFAS